MNTTIIRPFFAVSLVVAIAGGVAGDSSICMIGAVFVCAFGRMLWRQALENMPLKFGSESLPPAKDVAAVLVYGVPISEAAKKDLLKAMRRSKRAASCGSIMREIPFQIVDHWGGVWELRAYEETGGTRGFSANRVSYSGRAAEMVARCVGI